MVCPRLSLALCKIFEKMKQFFSKMICVNSNCCFTIKD